MTSKTKGIIYYTDNRLAEPIFSSAQKLILQSGLPIVSASLKPVSFGHNLAISGNPSYSSMIRQIVAALETIDTKHVFFCEHDVLYHHSHFDFLPPRNDVYYYNLNDWRWDYPKNRLIKYDGLTSLSQLCASKELALNHFKLRWDKMQIIGLNKFTQKDPHLARRWGYEPGRKKKRNGALLEEPSDTWYSKFPNIDIRHSQTFSLNKVQLKDFHHQPTGWQQTTLDKLPGWDVKELLSLCSKTSLS